MDKEIIYHSLNGSFLTNQRELLSMAATVAPSVAVAVAVAVVGNGPMTTTVASAVAPAEAVGVSRTPRVGVGVGVGPSASLVSHSSRVGKSLNVETGKVGDAGSKGRLSPSPSSVVVEDVTLGQQLLVDVGGQVVVHPGGGVLVHVVTGDVLVLVGPDTLVGDDGQADVVLLVCLVVLLSVHIRNVVRLSVDHSSKSDEGRKSLHDGGKCCC